MPPLRTWGWGTKGVPRRQVRMDRPVRPDHGRHRVRSAAAVGQQHRHLPGCVQHCQMARVRQLGSPSWSANRYWLAAALVGVDLRQFDAALARAHAAAGEDEQLTVLRQAAALYRGPLADGADYDWAEYHAEPARRRAVDALACVTASSSPASLSRPSASWNSHRPRPLR